MGLPTVVGPPQGIVGPDMVLWGRPNCLLDLPMGCPDLSMGRTMELGTSPWSEEHLRVVFLGVTIYPK